MTRHYDYMSPNSEKRLSRPWVQLVLLPLAFPSAQGRLYPPVKNTGVTGITLSQFLEKCEAAQLFSSLIIIRNVFLSTIQHIKMTDSDSKGSRDTDDWSNGWWKVSFSIRVINNIWKYIKIKTNVFTLFLIKRQKGPAHYLCKIFSFIK